MNIKYLGYYLTPEGLQMDPAKVKVIQDWLEPQNVRDIQSFLSLANFYQWFIRNYSEFVVPLTQLTHKDAPWNFTEDCHSTFNMLKHVFTSALVLTHWVPDTQLIVEINASNYALGAILPLVTDDGQIHPLTFHSWTFLLGELNYDTHDKELLTIYEAFWTWRHYLENSTLPIDIVTDHKNLTYFVTSMVLIHQQA